MKKHDDKNDTRQHIWGRLYDCLVETHYTVGSNSYPYSVRAWEAAVLTGGAGGLNSLLRNCKGGREQVLLLVLAELGEWWLHREENARHLARRDIRARVERYRLLARESDLS